MADNELKIKITAEDDASPAVKAAVEKLSSSMDKLSQTQASLNQRANQTFESQEKLNTGSINLASSLTVLKTGAELAMHAFEAIENQLHRAIEEALEAEKAQNKLAGALVNTGNYTVETVKELEDYVETTEKMTGTNGEAIKSMIAMGVQMGLTVEESKKLEEAARKLAAQAGIGTDEAFNRLKMTLNGASRGVAQYLPQIKELGEAQLKSGAAIEYVNKALSASYAIYQQSLPAAIQKAESSVNNVYKAFGQIITQNPLAIKAVNMFAEVMEHVAEAVQEAGKFISDHQIEVEKIIGAFGKAVAILAGGGGLIYAFTAASSAVGVLGAAFAVLTGPIGIAVAATAALTAAFYKWPGLFDIITGTVKSFIGSFLEGLAAITEYTGKFVGLFDTDLKNSLDKVTQSLTQSSQEWNKSGQAAMEYGIAANNASQVSIVATDKDTEARQKNLEKTSEQNAAVKEQADIYAGIDMGTERQRLELQAQANDRDTDKKEFQQYLDDKMQMAVSKENEQQQVLAELKAKQLAGTGGAQEKIATSDAEVVAQRNKQIELKAMRDEGALDEAQFQEAMLASKQAAQQAQLESELAFKEQRALLLGDSEEGYAQKQAIAEQRYQLELAQKRERGLVELEDDEQRNAMKTQMELQHQADMKAAKEGQIQNDIKLNEQAGNDFAVTQSKIELQQEKHGKVMGTIKGVQESKEFQGAQNALGNLSALQSSHNKEAFAVGKAAAIGQATINTFLAATAAYSSLAGIPLVGPVLGAAAAAAAIAAGIMNVQKISSQQMGQADEGMDSIPQPLSGKSFVLSGGERVVQPSANRDLKAFLARENGGGAPGEKGGGGGSSYNITLNYGGAGGQEDAQKMADIIINEIRSRSERGSPIMNEKGIVKA